MRGNEFLDKIELVDAAFVAEADETPAKKRSRVKWGAIAACLCVVVGAAAIAGRGAQMPQVQPAAPSTEDSASPAESYGFTLAGNDKCVYFPISRDERRVYGLSADEVFLFPKMTEDDLGELMGTVGDSGLEALVGCKVYHYAEYPDYDSICIVELPTRYEVYTAEWLNVEVQVGGSSDLLLEAYDLPASLEKLEILASDYSYLHTVEDADLCRDILTLLAGRENSGLEANERRFAQLWYDSYGNEDVYYSEESGHVVFKYISEQPPAEVVTFTDAEGNTVVMQNGSPGDSTLYDRAHAIWGAGERLIRITTARGFRAEIDWFPSIRTFQWGDGYFELSEEDAAALNALLQIE